VRTLAQWAKSLGYWRAMRCQLRQGLVEGAQPLVFLADPAHQVGVDARQEGMRRGAVERPVVLHPTPHDRIDPKDRTRSSCVPRNSAGLESLAG